MSTNHISLEQPVRLNAALAPQLVDESTDSDQTAPKADCSNVYVLDHILENM